MVKFCFIIFLGLVALPWLRSPANAAGILPLHQFAWSDNIGYINFSKTTVSDTALGGSAWSENKGFISFSTDLGGVVNDGTGNLSGSAWGQQLGWIDFSAVRIDENGNFTGLATGDLVGTITFDCPGYCDVQTDWRPRPSTGMPVSIPTGGGAGIPVAIQPSLNTNSEIAIIPPSNIPPGELALFDVVAEPIPNIRFSTAGFWSLVFFLELLLIGLILFLIWWIKKRRREHPRRISTYPAPQTAVQSPKQKNKTT